MFDVLRQFADHCLAIGGRVCLASAVIVATIMLSDKALTPLPQPREIPAPDRRLAARCESLEAEALRLRGEQAQLLAENATLKMRLDQLVRSAILFPAKPDELRPEDRIPPQQLAVPMVPPPAVFGINP